MKISIFGLGYVGAVTAGCLAQQGHQVVGVDVSEQKVQTLNRGESPIIEPGLEDLLKQARQRGLLRASTDAAEAVAATDLSLVCVGTPLTVSGAIDLGFARQVSEQIAEALRGRPKSHALVFRSTMVPGRADETRRRTAGASASGSRRARTSSSALKAGMNVWKYSGIACRSCPWRRMSPTTPTITYQ